MVQIYSKAELDKIKAAGDILKKLFSALKDIVVNGVSTKYIDSQIEVMINSYSAKCTSKGYYGYPASSCISVNDEVIHAIPNERLLRDGDIVSIDVVIEKDGYHADACRTFKIGEQSEVATHLVDVTEQAFFEGVSKAVSGGRIGDISEAIQVYVEKNGYSVVREYSGHGIGRSMHEEPSVPNYGRSGRGARLRAGMVLAIEPMVMAGGNSIITMPDKWTIKTADGKLAAHYENTVIITDGEPLIVTL